MFLVKERPIGGYRSWFLQYPVFQTSCKTVSELIQTDYLWASGLTSRKSRKRASRGLMYYCPELRPPNPSTFRKEQIGMSAYVSGEPPSWSSLQATHYSLGNLRAPQMPLPA